MDRHAKRGSHSEAKPKNLGPSLCSGDSHRAGRTIRSFSHRCLRLRIAVSQFRVSSSKSRVNPEPLFDPGSYFLTGQGFAKHLVAHVDPLVADFSNRFSHPA